MVRLALVSGAGGARDGKSRAGHRGSQSGRDAFGKCVACVRIHVRETSAEVEVEARECVGG